MNQSFAKAKIDGFPTRNDNQPRCVLRCVIVYRNSHSQTILPGTTREPDERCVMQDEFRPMLAASKLPKHSLTVGFGTKRRKSMSASMSAIGCEAELLQVGPIHCS